MPDTKTTARRMLLDPVETDETVLELGRWRTQQAFDRFDHIAVMFSGGKDSTCVLHLAMEEHARRGLERPLDVIFYDEECIPLETVEYVNEVRGWPEIDMRWYCLPVHHVNACSPDEPDWYPWDPAIPEKWCRELPEWGITLEDFKPILDMTEPHARFDLAEMNALLFRPEIHGTVGLLMGIRADESMTRRRAVLRRKEDNWIVPFNRFSFRTCRISDCTKPTYRPTATTCEEHKGQRLGETDFSDLANIFKCYLIYDWRTEDVWTFARDFARSHNRAYDLMEMAGIPHFKQRCAPPFGNEPMAGLWVFRECFPDLWDKMVDRVAGAATAARYARTELYAFSERPTVPEADWWDERAWKELIRTLLNHHGERTKRLTAERLVVFLNRHNAKTLNARTGAPDPILPDIPHPVTGLSWQWLAMVAERGDPKSRKNPEWQVPQRGDPALLERARKRYRDGLERRRIALREHEEATA